GGLSAGWGNDRSPPANRRPRVVRDEEPRWKNCRNRRNPQVRERSLTRRLNVHSILDRHWISGGLVNRKTGCGKRIRANRGHRNGCRWRNWGWLHHTPCKLVGPWWVGVYQSGSAYGCCNPDGDNGLCQRQKTVGLR